MATGAGEIQPLAGGIISSPLLGTRVDVPDIDSVGGVDRQPRGAIVVLAELELAIPLEHAIRIVFAVAVVAKVVAIVGFEGVAFALGEGRCVSEC